MASIAAALAEEEFALADDVTDGAGLDEHVGRVAGLTSGFHVRLLEQRPQPVLVVAMGLFYARGRAAISLVTGRAPELVGVVRLQKVRLRVAGKRQRVFVGGLGSFWHE